MLLSCLVNDTLDIKNLGEVKKMFPLVSGELALSEHVRYLMLGGDVIRSHDGVLHIYEDGSWKMFNGVIPEVVHHRVDKP